MAVVARVWTHFRQPEIRARPDWGVISDMGTERLVSLQHERLPDFMVYIDPALNANQFYRGEQLMPLALQVPGWRHRWGNVLQRNSLRTARVSSLVGSLESVSGHIAEGTNMRYYVTRGGTAVRVDRAAFGKFDPDPHRRQLPVPH